MFKYILAGVLYSHDSLDDAASDLSKALYGSRTSTLIGHTVWIMDSWVASHPSQIPVIFDGEVWTGSEFDAEMIRRDQATIQAKRDRAQAARAKRETWQNQSPMVTALREAGLV